MKFKIGQLVIVIKASSAARHMIGRIGEIIGTKKVYDGFRMSDGKTDQFVGYLVNFPGEPMVFNNYMTNKVVFPQEYLKPINDPDADISDSTESDYKVKPPLSVVRPEKVTKE